MNKAKIENIEIEGLDIKDYPKFCDAYISHATWKDTGEDLTEPELETLNEDADFVHNAVYDYLY